MGRRRELHERESFDRHLATAGTRNAKPDRLSAVGFATGFRRHVRSESRLSRQLTLLRTKVNDVFVDPANPPGTVSVSVVVVAVAV